MLFGKKYYYFFACLFGIFFAAGCSEPIRTLQALGAEKDAQAAQVKRQDIRFERLLKDVKEKRLKPGVSRRWVVGRYGRPVLDPVSRQEGVIFLYRKPTDFFNTVKIYLTFDQDDLLKDINIEELGAKHEN